jgi:hypothetical protein
MNTNRKRETPDRRRLGITAYRERYREIFSLLRRGFNYAATARQVGLSASRVGVIARRGGVGYALSWKVNEAVTVLVERKRDTSGAA